MSILKQHLKKLITKSTGLLRAVNLVSGDFPKVFVYHRFAPHGCRISHRVSADEFGWQLDQIAGKFRVITFDECLRHFEEFGKWPRNCVVITVDDGYRDFFEWGYPQLVQRSLKATFFVTVNFVEGKIWLWPDRLEYAISKTSQPEIVVALPAGLKRIALKERLDKAEACKTFISHCIKLPDDEKERFIVSLLTELNVELPDTPPIEYGPANWKELRAMMKGGVEIGTHTLNHPILSRITSERLIEEIGDSKRIMEEKLNTEITTFCYPNSAPGDITEAVVNEVRRQGYRGAVFGTNLKEWNQYRVPRMGINDNRSDFLWKLYGGEAI